MKIDFYTTDWCGDCVRSKALLNRLNVDFNEIGNEVSVWIKLQDTLQIIHNQQVDKYGLNFVGELLSKDVEAFHQSLVSVVDAEKQVQLDFSEVKEIDSLCIGKLLNFGWVMQYSNIRIFFLVFT